MAIAASCMVFSYLLALTIEIVIKLQNATVVTYSKRNILYHCCSVSVALAFCLSGLLRDDFGETAMRTCSLQDSKATKIAYSAYIFVSVLAIWTLLIVIWSKLRTSSSAIFFNYSIVVVSVTTTVSISLMMDFLKDYSTGEGNTYRPLGVVSGSLTGTCIALARLSNRKLLKKLYGKLCLGKRKMMSDTMLSMMSPEETISEEGTFLSDFFDNITKKVRNMQTIFQILVMMQLRFQRDEDFDQGVSASKKYSDCSFTEKMYKKVIHKSFGKLRYKNCNSKTVALQGKVLREYKRKEFKKVRDVSGIDPQQLQE